jgi:hypothetical protein
MYLVLSKAEVVGLNPDWGIAMDYLHSVHPVGVINIYDYYVMMVP